MVSTRPDPSSNPSLLIVETFRQGILSVHARTVDFFATIMVELFMLYTFVRAVLADDFLVYRVRIASVLLIALEFIVTIFPFSFFISISHFIFKKV